jgi:hypothetical protein
MRSLVKIKKLLAVTIIAAGLVIGSGLVNPSQAQAASTCGVTHTLGSPQLINIGVRNPNTVRNSSNPKNYIYYGSPEYFCPSGGIYVHAGYDIKIYCSTGVYYWIKAYGWQNFQDYCQNSTWIKINEYQQ